MSSASRLSRARMLATACAVAFPVACAGSDRDSAPRSVASGDDSVVISAVSSTGRADVREFWRSDSLERVLQITVVRGGIAVSDRERIFVIDDSGGLMQSLGGNGDGPGEYRVVAGLRQTTDSSLIVYDARSLRLTTYDRNYRLQGTSQILPPPMYPLPRRYTNVIALSDSGLWLLNTSAFDSRQEVSLRAALFWYGSGPDTPVMLEEWPDLRMMSVGGRGLMTRDIFPRGMSISMNSGGDVAYGDGMVDCIHIRTAHDADVRQICRDRKPRRMTAAIRNEDFAEINNPGIRESIVADVGKQRVPENLPFFDDLFLDDLGWVWARTLQDVDGRYHPFILRSRPDLRPEWRAWDVCSLGRKRCATVELPRAFTPMAASEDIVFGLLVSESGEEVVGVGDLPATFVSVRRESRVGAR
jgi:hypothetical protein